jgi:acetyl-CoA carboxylase biotin carboxyl carrier protein
MSGLSREDIDDIMRLLEHSSFDELKLEMGDTRIELRRRGGAGLAGDSPSPAPGPAPAVDSPPLPPASAPKLPHPGGPTHGGVDVPAPQLGIFYHAPRPGEAPFVTPGDEVHVDTVIGIIEVMKLMNTVPAGIAGIVTEIVAPNGQSVKQGDTLIRVEPIH